MRIITRELSGAGIVSHILPSRTIKILLMVDLLMFSPSLLFLSEFSSGSLSYGEECIPCFSLWSPLSVLRPGSQGTSRGLQQSGGWHQDGERKGAVTNPAFHHGNWNTFMPFLRMDGSCLAAKANRAGDNASANA